MIDLQRVDHKAFPRARAALAGRGACVTLRAGEAVYIPTHWWHHVQGVAGKRSWCISVNFWFTITKAMLTTPHPYPLHFELARHAEFLLADTCGSGAVGRIAELLRADVEGEDSGRADVVTLAARNFTLARLARLIGPENVKAFVHQYFPAERFDRQVVQQALQQGPKRGAREKA